MIQIENGKSKYLRLTGNGRKTRKVEIIFSDLSGSEVDQEENPREKL
jgi:hypothetical protein